MYNLTRKINDKHHPHVDSDGVPCLGNIAKAIPDYMAGYEFSVVAMLCIEFLKTADPNDGWGATVKDWPVIKNKK